MIGLEPGLHLHHDERLGGELELVGERDPKAWSAPRTWVAGEVLTASLMNVHLRDQFLWLGGVDARSSTPPGTPIDGHLWRAILDATTGTHAYFAYNSGSASAYKWERLGGGVLYSLVETAQATTTFPGPVDLATVGPSITLPRGGDYEANYGAGGILSSSGSVGYVFLLAGGVEQSRVRNGSSAANIPAGRKQTLTGRAAADVIKLGYGGVDGATHTFDGRFLYLRPLRVS